MLQPELNETFEKARIIVGPANPVWGDVPYTIQPGLCGEEGDYVHLTANYLTRLISGG